MPSQSDEEGETTETFEALVKQQEGETTAKLPNTLSIDPETVEAADQEPTPEDIADAVDTDEDPSNDLGLDQRPAKVGDDVSLPAVSGVAAPRDPSATGGSTAPTPAPTTPLPKPIATNGPGETPASTPLQTSPHSTDGPEGPVVPVQKPKEPDMQLSRQPRLRSYPSAAMSAAAQQASRAAGDDVVQIQRPLAVVPTGRDTPDPGTGQRTLMAPLSEPDQLLRRPSPTGGAVIAAAMGEARPQTQSTDGLLPRALAGYSALVPTEINQAQASDSAEPEDFRMDPLSPRTLDGSSRQPDAISQTPRFTPRTAEAVAHQLAQIAQSAAQHRRDVLLQPEELGKVRLSLQASETAVNVSILVERPETLDLMRKHISQLADEFRAMGYQDVSFEFAQQKDDDRADAQSQTGRSNQSQEPQADPDLLPALSQNLTVTTNIDRRI